MCALMVRTFTAHPQISPSALVLMQLHFSLYVSPRWVYMATKHGRRVPESEHAVGGTTLAMESLKQSSVTADKTNSRELSTENKELITPFRSLQPKLNTRVS